MPLGCGVAAGAGLCALTQTTVMKNQSRRLVNRIDQTFQQGTFGPGEIVKTRIAEETPAAKN